MSTYSNYSKNSVVSGGSGTDSIYNYAGGAQIYGGSGNDYIFNSTRNNYTINSSYGYVTLSGGSGNDTIYNNDPYVYISGGSGNDSISLSSNYSRYVTVYGGSGNDKIYDGGGYNTYHFYSGDGNDTIYNWNSTNTLNLNGAYYSRSTIGNNVVISVLSGNGGAITLSGTSDKTVNITNGVLANVITNTNKNSVISGTTAIDAILNYAGGVNIYGNYGDDYIFSSTRTNYTINSSYGYVTIRGEGGNDYIANNDPYVFIYGDQGNDTITLNSNYSKYVTVYGGLGNDIIYGGGTNNQYRFYSGDGFDTIYNLGSTDTLNLNGAHYTRSTVGSDIIVSITSGSGGAMTLSGASDKTINIINGTEDNGATLNNTVSGKTVNGSSYVDSITNSGSTVKIYAYTDNDYIYNTGSYVSIDAGGGDDTVYSTTGTRVSIFGGIGEDSIYNRSNYSTVSAGIGNDTIYNVTYYSSVNGGSGNDYIYNYSYYATINGSSGNDTITLYSSAANNIIDYQPGDGYDLVRGFNETTTLRIGNGTGTYSSARSGSNVNDIIITSGAGNVTLQGAATLSTVNIQGVDNSPTSLNLTNTLSEQFLNGSEYKDTITSSGSYVTIQANGGNDSITNTSGNNITIDGGLGSDTIRVSFAETISINGGDGNDSISCNHNYATITGGAGSDTIVGNHWRSQLYGGADNDYINITNYWYNTIDGGDGSDTIYAGGSQHSVSGGAGADKISLSGNNLTVNGGTGNDVIYGSTATSHLYQYKAGDGNDTIYNWSSSDTLTVTGGEVTSTSKGNNVTLTVGSNKILLYGAKDKTININGKSTTPVELLTPQDVIKKFMKSLDTSTTKDVSTMLDNAIKAVSNSSSITTMKAAITKMVNDCKSYDGDWDSFLKEKCDINLDSDNEDTGAISGADAGASKTEKTASSIVEETGSVDRTFEDNSFKSNGLTVELRKDFSTLGEKEQYIWQGLRSWWLPGALNLIAESYGNNFSFTSESSSTISNKMYVKFYDDPYNGELASVGRTGEFDSNGDLSGDLELSINMSYYKNIIVNNTDGKMSNRDDFYLDRVLAHEFTHAVMNANIKNATGYSGLPQFIKDGMSELTHGIDDDRTSDIIAYASDSAALEKALNVDKLFNHYPAYAGGYMFLRYIAKQFSDSANDSSYSDKSIADSSLMPTGLTRSGKLFKAAKTFKENKINLARYGSAVTKVNATAVTKSIAITGSSTNDSIKSGKKNDTIYGGTGNDSLWGGKGNDIIYGGSGNDKIYGQDGNDSIYAGIGNDTLTGGKGKDIFACEGGKDIITDYTPGEDKIKILSGSITSTSFTETDVILGTDSGSIVVQGGKNKKITVIDTDDNESTSLYSDTLMAVDDNTPSPVTIGATYEIIDASSRTTAVKIMGNALANSIVGGSGNDSLNGAADSDTLHGNAGNDTLTGGAGNDVFVYTSGKDTITDYASGDKISLGAAISKASVSGKNVVFTTADGKLTVKKAKGKSLDITDSNGKSYSATVSKTNAMKISLTDTTSSPITLDAAIKTVDASSRKKAVNITGNALANSISGGSGKDKLYGADGNDTIIGGKGNDSLWGDAGDDTFIYSKGDGKDVIYGFEDNDLLQITGTFSASYNASKNSVAFKVGSGSITLKDFGSTTFFHVNNDTYELSGGKLTKK